MSNETILSTMSSTAKTTAKLEAIARARAWRDSRRCSTPPRSAPTSAKKAKKTASESFTHESPRRVPARSPSVTTSAMLTPKQVAKERSLIRAREYSAKLKEKKEQIILEQSKEVSMDIDNGIDDSGIPVVINIDDGNLSNVSATTAHETSVSAAEMEEMKRIATDMKKLSDRLEAVTTKNSGCN